MIQPENAYSGIFLAKLPILLRTKLELLLRSHCLQFENQILYNTLWNDGEGRATFSSAYLFQSFSPTNIRCYKWRWEYRITNYWLFFLFFLKPFPDRLAVVRHFANSSAVHGVRNLPYILIWGCTRGAVEGFSNMWHPPPPQKKWRGGDGGLGLQPCNIACFRTNVS